MLGGSQKTGTGVSTAALCDHPKVETTQMPIDSKWKKKKVSATTPGRNFHFQGDPTTLSFRGSPVSACDRQPRSLWPAMGGTEGPIRANETASKDKAKAEFMQTQPSSSDQSRSGHHQWLPKKTSAFKAAANSTGGPQGGSSKKRSKVFPHKNLSK